MGHIKKLECRKPILVDVGPSVVNAFDERSCCSLDVSCQPARLRQHIVRCVGSPVVSYTRAAQLLSLLVIGPSEFPTLLTKIEICIALSCETGPLS